MNNNIILVILLACILFIYGILFNIKNKQTQLIIESFNNVQNIFKEPLKELNNNQQGIYLSRMEPFMLGTWTTNESTVTGNQVNNVMIIAKNEDKNNFSFYSYYHSNTKNRKYKTRKWMILYLKL